MNVKIMYRNNYDGGDGWKYYPIEVTISDLCPQCAGKRGEAQLYSFFEDGEHFIVDRWDNPCGHIDKYSDVYHESKSLKKAG